MEELMKIPPCNGDKPSQLRFIYDKVSVHVRGLEALGADWKQYGSLLIPVIMAKLPAEVRLQIARNTNEEVWEMSAILNIILKEVEAWEISESLKVNNPDNRKPMFSSRTPSATALATQAMHGKSIQCVYCKEHHFSASCDRVTDTSECKEILKRDQQCFICLGKIIGVPNVIQTRIVDACHQSICQRSKPPYIPPSETKGQSKPFINTDDPPRTKDQPDQATTAATRSQHNKVILQTAVTYAQATNNSKSVPVRVLLDSGSQRSYITNSLKMRLGLVPIKTETLHLNTFGDENFTKRCDMVQLSLKGKSGDHKITALCFNKICSPLTTTLDLSRYPHLQGLHLSDLDILEGRQADSNIDILIGADYYFDILTGEVVRGEGGPIAINSEFGWVVSGPTNNIEAFSGISVSNLSIEKQGGLPIPNSSATNEDELELSKTLHRFWEIESMGIKEEGVTTEDFLPEVRYKQDEGRYEVNLPWKAGCTAKSDGYVVCMKCLRQLQSRLNNDKALMKEYDEIIKEQEKMGIIDPAVETEENSHFLPHHGVIRQDKTTTKLRVVFDASSKSGKEDLSLNDCLEKGPNLVPHLFDTVVKFRGYPIGLVADIEKAFHQIEIAPDDRKMLKFLWFEDIYQENPRIKEYQFRCLPFGLTPSPAILSSTTRLHLSQYKETEPEIASLLLESFYVDDFAGGAYDKCEALRIYRTSKDLMSKGGFTLRKWHSNSPYLRDIIATKEDATSINEEEKTSREFIQSNANASVKENVNEAATSCSSPQDKCESQKDCYVKFLGINWNVETDEFRYDLGEMVEYAQSLPATKRSVLRFSAKVVDPIGLVLHSR